MNNYTIEAIADWANTTPRAIRLWEDEGFLGKIDRDDRERRIYTDDDLDTARLVSTCRALGMINESILKVVTNYDDVKVSQVKAQIRAKIGYFEKLMRDLPQPPAPKAQEPEEWDL